MVDDIADYRYQSFYMWKNTKESELLNNSKIKDMTLKEYEEYIDSELHVDALDTVYISPRQVKVDGEYKVLLKRVETFFEQDRDINRNQNIKKAYEYGYRKTEIALFVGLHPNSVAKIV